MGLFVAAHGILVVNERMLVLRRSQLTLYMPGKWDVPGGDVEGDESLEQALTREFSEETSLSLADCSTLYAYSNLSQLPDRKTFQIVFMVNCLAGNVVLRPEEHDDYRWVRYDEAVGLNCIAYLKACLEQPQCQSTLRQHGLR